MVREILRPKVCRLTFGIVSSHSWGPYFLTIVGVIFFDHSWGSYLLSIVGPYFLTIVGVIFFNHIWDIDMIYSRMALIWYLRSFMNSGILVSSTMVDRTVDRTMVRFVIESGFSETF